MMNINVFLRFGLALFLFIAMGKDDATAQTAEADSLEKLVEILGANNGRIVVEDGEKIQYLNGNVRLRQKQTLFYANRASNYDSKGKVILEGDVRIVDKADTLWADRVDYDSLNKKGKASKNVRLTDGEAYIYSESGLYDINAKWASFDSPLRLEDSTIVLESKRGAYDLNSKIAYFADEVVLQEESSTIFADSLTHFRNSGLSNALGNVSVFYQESDVDTTSLKRDELALFGETLNYSRDDSLSEMSGKTFAMQVRHDSTSSDTLGIKADVFRVKQSSSVDSLIADGRVLLWTKTYQSNSDSLAYLSLKGEEREHVEILKEPILWYDESQITGDSVRINLLNQEIDSLMVRGNAFVASRDSSISRYNQTRAVNLDASFLESEPQNFVFMPAAEAVFFRSDSTDVKDISAFKLSSERINFEFSDGEIDQVSALKNEGSYYEPGIVPSDLSLPGFNWFEEKRPVKKKVILFIQEPSVKSLQKDG